MKQTALRTGGNYYIEFKSDLVSNNELSKEVVAFANAEGGIIYFGVDDDGTVVGSTKRKASREELLRLLQSSGHFQYDNTPVGHADMDDLGKGKLSDYFKDIYQININIS